MHHVKFSQNFHLGLGTKKKYELKLRIFMPSAKKKKNEHITSSIYYSVDGRRIGFNASVSLFR